MRTLLSTLLLFLLLATSAHAAVDPVRLAAVRTLMQERKLPEAQAALEQWIATQPGEADLHSLLGELLVRREDTDAAIKSLLRAIELAPTVSSHQRRLGDAYGRAAQKAGMLSKMGLARKCRDAYEKAVALDPANIDARFALMGYYRQAPGIVGGGIDKAHLQADEIIKLDPLRGKIAKAGLFTAEKKFTEAFALFETTLESTPDDYQALYQFGRLAADSGQHLDRGLAALQKCLTLDPPADAPGRAPTHWRLGNIWEKKGDKSAARAAYEAALAADATFENARTALQKL